MTPTPISDCNHDVRSSREEMSRPRLITAHDYLTQRGGAERVALELTRGLGATSLITSFYSPQNTFPEFGDVYVNASALNFIPIFKRDPRLALPFLRHIWSNRPPVEADAVVCSSSGWSHGLPVSADTAKIVYCHNPARWLYQPDDYFLGSRRITRSLMNAMHSSMLEWDQEAARTADLYIANSTSVAARILKVYGRKPEVLFPPVCVNVDGPQEPMDGSESPFFVAVSRPRAYKGIEALANAFRRLPRHRLYIVGRRTIDNCPDNVRALGTVSDSRLRWLYANARGLISVSLEDFGLTPLEANAFGTPALLLRAGGFLDSLDEGISGSYIEEISEESIVDAVNRFPVEWDRNLIRSHAQRFSAREFERKMTELVKSVIGRKSGHVQ